jgi:hypothetical protein
MEIQRLKRSNNKLQKENVDLKREKRNAGKGEVTVHLSSTPALRHRNTMYIPSTQKIGLRKKRKTSNENGLMENFEPDENKIDQIEANIFTKITESVEKIFNVNPFDTRSTFTGYSMITSSLDFNPEIERRQTLHFKQNERKHSIEDRFQEIAEVPEEEEKETRKGTM